MVHWTDNERRIITDLWAKVKPEEIGPQAVARLLIVYPWNQKYFTTFGKLSSIEEVKQSPKVAAHGAVVLYGLDKAIRNLDRIRTVYAQLSELHSETLHMDPSNYTLLSECITVCLAAKFGPSYFTPEVHEVWQKFLNVVEAALCKRYH